MRYITSRSASLKGARVSVGVLHSCILIISCSISQAVNAQASPSPHQVPTQDENERVYLPPDQVEAGRRNEESLESRGFVEMHDESRRVDEVLARIEVQKEAAIQAGRPHDPEILGYTELDRDSYSDFFSAPYNPATLHQKYLKGDSRSYLLLGAPVLTQLHTNTEFGTLLIEEHPNTRSFGGVAPNTIVDGQAANIAHIEYADGKWASAVFIQHGTSFFIVESDRRISDDDLPDYLGLVENLVRTAQEKRR